MRAKKKNIHGLFKKHLGKKDGEEVAAMIDKMAKAKKSSAEIEDAVTTECATRLFKRGKSILYEFKICLETDAPTAPPRPCPRDFK